MRRHQRMSDEKKARVFVLVDVGCIECGESTKVLGVYATREAVETRFREFAATVREADAEPPFTSFFTGGQHSLEIHEATQHRAND